MADVCARFRYNAQAYFAHSKLKESNLLEISEWRNQELLLTSKVLRNFGALITSIRASSNRYCAETVSELRLYDVFVTEKLLILAQPLFRHLQTLEMINCQYIGSPVKMMPTVLPELTKLIFTDLEPHYFKQYGHGGLYQTFTKLETISFEGVESVTNDDIEMFLKRNSQLKKKTF